MKQTNIHATQSSKTTSLGMGLLIATALLSACGGGGDEGSGGNTPAPQPPATSHVAGPAPSPGTGSSPAPSPGVPVAPAPAPGAPSGVSPAPAPVLPANPPATTSLASTIQVSVPAPTYPVGSGLLAAFDLLNNERARCGFGRYRQNVRLDLAAADHSRWMALNLANAHFQDGNRFPNGFVGVTPIDRAAARGYAPASVGEDYVYASHLPERAVPAAQSWLRALLSAPLHMSSLMGFQRDVGIGSVQRRDLGLMDNNLQFLAPLVLNLGRLESEVPAQVGSGEIVTYPCEGTTGVFPGVYGEDPNPIPGRDLATNPIGPGILIRGRFFSDMVLASFSLRETSTGASVAIAAPLTRTTSPSAGPGSVMLIPDTILKDNTRYTVSARGTLDGVDFNRTFTFTTGAFFQ